MNISGLRLPVRQTRAAAGAKRGSFDLPFFVLTLLLLTIGVIMVLSSSFARAYAQGKSPRIISSGRRASPWPASWV